jgi:hypothetical protein
MSKDRRLTNVLTPVRPIPEMEVRAVLTVLEHAVDAEDAAELLAMLGLIKPSADASRDQLCPSRSAHRRLRSRRSARRSGPVSEGSGGRE